MEDRAMRKLFISALSMLAVALGFTACTSDDEFTSTPETSRLAKVCAIAEQPSATRATLGENRSSVVWEKGDKITIGGKEFTLEGEGGSSTGVFVGEAPAAGTYDAYYNYDGTNWPANQTYVSDNITGAPMEATDISVSGNVISDITFKNIGGILRLNLILDAGAAARSISKVVVSSSKQLDKDIVLNCATPVGLNEETDVPFHIAVPAKDYTDLKFTIYDNTGYKCTKSLVSGNTLTVKRSMITNVSLKPKSWIYAGLCFTAKTDGAIIEMEKHGTVSMNIEYSTDLSTWNTFTPGTTEVTLTNVGDKVYFRGNNPNGFNERNNYVCFQMENGNYEKVDASGNVMSLIDPTCKATTIPNNYCFYNLFQNCVNLMTAPELPATTLTDHCYYYMFNRCDSLKTAPELPATTLANYCYSYMFYFCEKLETASLPATTLADYCCQNMFSNCTSLKTAPELPATTLAKYCYNNMFSGCTSLTTAPELPAETLANYCYQNMFNGCTSLKTAPALTATTLASSCYSNMFKGCTSLKTAPALPATTLAVSCYSFMFNGCASLKTAPALPATTLTSSCYSNMFNGCTSLTTAPTLPATTLTSSCYNNMFNSCKSLNSVTCLATDNSASGCVNNWLKDAASGTLYCAPGCSGIWSSKIPSGWTVTEKK